MNNTKNPIIGITPQIDYHTGEYKIGAPYTDCLLRLGATPLLFPFTTDEQELARLIALCDGFLLTGGHDIDPAYYGETKADYCNTPVPIRDQLEMKLIPMAIASAKPILAICRGIQTLNVALGGTLYQDIEAQGATVKSHRCPDTPNAHTVTATEGTLTAEIFGTQPIAVNSLHHQAIRKLGTGLAASAISEDGLIESVYMPDRPFVLGVQWHPELLAFNTPAQMQLFRRFVAATKN